MRIHLIVLLPAFGLACSEYDLNRPDDPPDEPIKVDTGDTSPPDTSAPDIEIEPSSLDFGYVMKDCDSDPQDITITNVGDADLVIDSITFMGTSSGAFSYSGSAETLTPDQAAVLSLVFTPTAWITYDEVELTIVSNDPDEGEAYVPTTGVGSEDPYYEETFHQGEPGPVDILWVVDNSGSMEDEILRVKEEFSVFIGEFVEMDLDFHLGAITTDMDFLEDDAGQLQGDPTYFDNTYSDPEGAFGTTIDEIYSMTGSGSEKGLDAVLAALQEPLLSGANAGFYRDTTDDGTPVAIHTIVVTDEDDDSDTVSSSSFASWYNGLKADPDTANFSAICGDPVSSTNWMGGCMEWDTSSGRMLEASAGTKYVDVVDATGGYWASICTAEFSEALQYLSLETMGMSAVYELTYTPSSIALTQVQVDGASVSYSAVDGWTYTTDNNAVNFHGDAIPDPSAEIYVNYPYDGGC